MNMQLQPRTAAYRKWNPSCIMMIALSLLTGGCNRTAENASAPAQVNERVPDPASSKRTETRAQPTLAEELERARKQDDWHEKCTAFFQLWGKKNPQESIALAGTLPATERDICLRTAFAAWLTVSSADACAWLEKHAIDKDRLLFTHALVDATALPPERLAAFVEPLLKQPGSQHLLRTFLDHWTATDPGKAAHWMLQKQGTATLEVRPSLDNETQVFFGNWTSKDPQQAGAFIKTLPEGHARDSAIAAFSRQAVMQNPEAAAAWAAKIKNTKLREETLALLQAVSSQLVFQGNAQEAEAEAEVTEPAPTN